MDCITAGNLMVQLFLQAKTKYQLSNKKLQYLLCIAQLMSISSGRVLFDESIRNLKNGFVLEPIADTFTVNSFIQNGALTNRELNLVRESLCLPYSGKKLYEVHSKVSDEDKELLIDVFINFGGYKEDTLCRMLNEFSLLRKYPLWSFITPDDITSYFDKVFADVSSISRNLKSNKIFILCCEKYVEEKARTVSQPVVDSSEPAGDDVTKGVNPVVFTETRKLLKPHITSTLKNLIVGRSYCVYIETSEGVSLQDVKLIAKKDNNRIRGVLTSIQPNVYCYSFVGVASDIKVSVVV